MVTNTTKGSVNLKRKKILYLADSDLSKPGGAQQSMKLLILGLNSDFDMYVIAPRGKKLFDRHIVLNNYENFRIRGRNIKEIFSMAKEILSIIKNVNPDIIHIQMNSTLVLINLLLRLKLLNKKTKIIYTDRGVYGKYGALTKRSIDSIIPIANKIVTTTEINKRNYSNIYQKYAKYRDKFEVVYNTAGKLYDDYHENLREISRNELEINDEDLVVGFCGRYSEQKNWPLAKEIIKKCNEVFENICFIICLGTDGSENENKKAKKFISEIKANIGDASVKSFINIENNELSQLYYAFDFFILTSRWESFGRTAVEAMSRKNIVFGTNVDGLSEVIGDKEFLFQNSDEVVEKLTFLLSNRAQRLDARDYFYNRYHTKFGYKSNIERYKDMYIKLLT